MNSGVFAVHGCRPTDCDQGPPLMGVLTAGEPAHVGGQGEHEKSLPSPRLCCEPRNALKKTLLKEIQH